MTHVAENLSVLRVVGGQLQLWRAGTSAFQAVGADTQLPDNTVFAVPAELVRLHELSVTAAEAKHIAKSLPFLLEEEVAEDIDGLHFAHAPLGEQRFAVGIVAVETMTELNTYFDDVMSPARWLPESLLLPWRPGECVAVVEDDRVLLRWGANAGTAVSHQWLPLLLESLGELAEQWVIYGEQAESLEEYLPDGARIDRRQGHFGNALMLAEVPADALNLRQGEYAPRLPLARWWTLWRPLAVAASIAVVLQFGSDVAQWQRLKAENAALYQAITDSYRRANPRGSLLIDRVEKQLDDQIRGLRGAGAGGRPFTPLLTQVVRALAASGDIDLSTLNYSTSGDLRMTMTAPDFASVEALRGRLDSAGFDATLEGTSARGERISARLVVAAR